ncbi:MAG: hypothetical protein HZB18_14840 [Chloroflexi bacterium]|nr:hypothetical protein [Chloroflexota bacterium]
MNSLEAIIMEEISTLPDIRLIDVIGFIRYLKSEKPEKPQWIEEWFESALQSVRARQVELKTAQIDIEHKPARTGKRK